MARGKGHAPLWRGVTLRTGARHGLLRDAMTRTARPTTFGAVLRAELTRRCAKNESYSLRAFAKFLAVDHATLSQIIRGRRELTAETIERLGERLGLSPEVIEAFVEDARSSRAAPPSHSHSIAAEAERIAADPIHHSILALMTTADFRPDSRFIAQVLDATVDEVNVAVQRLARFGILRMGTSADWRDTIGGGHLDPAAFDDRVWEHAARRLVDRPHAEPPAPTTVDEPRAAAPARQFQMLARDPAAAAAFYRDLFGWTIDDANALGYRRIFTGPRGFDGGIWPSPPEAPAFVQLFIEVDNVPDAVARAQQLSAKVALPPQALPDGDEMAILLDPQGISFGVFRPAQH